MSWVSVYELPAKAYVKKQLGMLRMYVTNEVKGRRLFTSI